LENRHRQEQEQGKQEQQLNLIDVCIHTAALSAPAKCEIDPVAATEINVPQAFFDRLHQHNPFIKVIALSTDQVYCGTKNALLCYKEDDVTVPCNHYGRTKLALEEYLQTHRLADATICLRSSIMLGPQAPLVPAHNTFLHFCAGRRATPTTYYTDEIRSVIAVSDVVEIVLKCANLTNSNSHSNDNNHQPAVRPGVYCMGGPMAVSRHDMAVATLAHVLQQENRKQQQQQQQQVLDTEDYNSSNQIAMLAVTQRKAEQPPCATAVASPLNIAMDSSKLIAAVGMTGKMKTLSEMVAQTFGCEVADESDIHTH
jgi:dTDP-4-dehydrorhamnose reductase